MKGLKAAANCGPSAPGIAHMWHMPGHIYSKLKRYRDAGITEFLLFKCNELPLDDAGLAAGLDEAARRYVDLAAEL